jgi:hypothetical protein
MDVPPFSASLRRRHSWLPKTLASAVGGRQQAGGIIGFQSRNLEIILKTELVFIAPCWTIGTRPQALEETSS